LLPLFIFHIGDRPIGHLSEIVHQDINPAKPGDSFLDGSLDSASVECVGWDGESALAAGFDLLNNLLRLVEAAPA
jgi:hypothetical protein